MQKYSLAIHGGAGTILRSAMTTEQEQAHRQALLAALAAGTQLLEKGESALDAVEAAARALEDCEYFNAGRGGGIYT